MAICWIGSQSVLNPKQTHKRSALSSINTCKMHVGASPDWTRLDRGERPDRATGLVKPGTLSHNAYMPAVRFHTRHTDISHPGDADDGQYISFTERQVLFGAWLEVILGNALCARWPWHLLHRRHRGSNFKLQASAQRRQMLPQIIMKESKLKVTDKGHGRSQFNCL